MTTGATRKIRCAANYKNGNPCRAYSVRGYLCARHQSLCTNAEVRAKVAEIKRQNTERERQFNAIVAQEAHTRLKTAPSLAIYPWGRIAYSGHSNRRFFVSVEDCDKVGWDSIYPSRYSSADHRFTPYRDQGQEHSTGWSLIRGLEPQRERQSELSRLTGSIRAWGLEVQGFVKSNLLCTEMKPYGDVFPGAKRAKNYTYVNCPNPRVEGRVKCLPCRRETQAMHNDIRRHNEKRGACEHGSDCWPSLDAVIKQGGGRCHYCGESVTRGLGKNTDAHRDHYIPVSRGGLHCKDNAVLACSHCNGSKHDNMLSSTEKPAALI
ncbi:MAG: HNH endonuclease signature motif containing protein [Chloroflexota bacterium]|nr:HNH endonuclease signature motif containing protein [Chloroflexota bacterium]MDE2958783.1 HNH endonuclease signature motif containing protein [Chloroflexota bacterium]